METARLVAALGSTVIGAVVFARLGLLLFDQATRTKGVALSVVVSIGIMGVLVGLLYYLGLSQGRFDWTVVYVALGFGIGMMLGLVLAGILRISRRRRGASSVAQPGGRTGRAAN
jgi:uncharacterized membrane protein